VQEYRLDRVLPAPQRQGIVAQRTEIRIEHQGWPAVMSYMSVHSDAPPLLVQTTPVGQRHTHTDEAPAPPLYRGRLQDCEARAKTTCAHRLPPSACGEGREGGLARHDPSSGSLRPEPLRQEFAAVAQAFLVDAMA